MTVQSMDKTYAVTVSFVETSDISSSTYSTRGFSVSARTINPLFGLLRFPLTFDSQDEAVTAKLMAAEVAPTDHSKGSIYECFSREKREDEN